MAMRQPFRVWPVLLPVTAFNLALFASSLAMAQTVWPSSFTARLEVLALLQSLNADLLSHDSATETLRRWCSDHQLSPAQSIIAERVHDQDKAPDAATLATLAVKSGEAVRYRRVRLACGGRVLSEADNWYLPTKLTSAMNQALDTGDTPFGLVVKPLGFHRRTLSAALLFNPLPVGWDLAGSHGDAGGNLTIPHEVIQHRAVLTNAASEPFSVVVETYTDKVLPDRAP
jgi:chorismate-pyruvate lyase